MRGQGTAAEVQLRPERLDFGAQEWPPSRAPAGMPKAIVSRLNQSVARILRLPEVQERLRAGGADAAPSTPEAFALAIARDIATWSKVVKAGNIRIN